MCAVPQPCRTCRVPAPICCVPYVPEAQGSLPRGHPAWTVPYSPQAYRGTPGQRRVVISGKIFHHASFADGDCAQTSALIQVHLHAPAPHLLRPAPPPSLAPAPAAPALHPLCTRSAPALHPLCTRSARALHPLCTHSALAVRPLRTRPVPSPLPSPRRRVVGLRRSTARTTSARPAPTRPPASALSRRAQSSTPTTLSTATPLGQSARALSSAWATTQPRQWPPACSGLPSGA